MAARVSRKATPRPPTIRSLIEDIAARLARVEADLAIRHKADETGAKVKIKWEERLWGVAKSVIAVLLAAALLWCAQWVQCVPPPPNTSKVEIRP